MTAAAEGVVPPGRVFSVTALTQSIRKNLLANNAKLADVWIEGEISGNKIYSSGHRYFALKDANATISCVLFAFNVGACDEGFRAALRQGESSVDGLKVQALHPQARVLYVSANTFKLQYQDARKDNRIPDFLNFYQSVDVLIVDDIQYFAGLKGTQDTFFHIFNYLQQSRKQLILTSDRPPIELKDIEERLLTRFKWGLAAEIQRPDYQLRKDILLSKMRRDGITLSDEIVDFIAQSVKDSVRDLEGILASLLAHSTLTDQEIDLALTEKVVSHIVAVQPHRTTVDDVLEEVSKHYNVSQKAILSSNRSKEISQARHVTAYLCKKLTQSSLTEIGFRLGRRTHATMLHSIAYVNGMLEEDPVLRQHIAQLQSALHH